MAKAVYTTKRGLTVGIAQLGIRADGRGSVGQEVHDGDTVTVDPFGSLGFRFLGVDAPEVSFTLPVQSQADMDSDPIETTFVGIDDPRWEAVPLRSLRLRLWTDRPRPRPAPVPGSPGRARDCRKPRRTRRCGSRRPPRRGQRRHGNARPRRGDLQARLRQRDHGLLRPLPGLPELRQARSAAPSLLQPASPSAGQVTPYFIWPNLDPYRKQERLVDAVLEPGSVTPAGVAAEAGKPLEMPGSGVREARDEGLGVWKAEGPLSLLPFELRFLSRRKPPDRWVIDLSAGDDKILAPQLYHRIADPEDRLFVAEEYLQLFASQGWNPTES